MLQGLVMYNCRSLEGIVAFEYENEEVINFESLTMLILGDLPSFSGMSKNVSKGPERPPEDSSAEQSDVITQPLSYSDDSSSEQADVITEHLLFVEKFITEHLFNSEACFPALRSLDITRMNFKKIWNNQLLAESFCELEFLKVDGCDCLLHLVPTHMQNRLHKLKSIEVRDCSSLKEIFEIKRLIVGDEGEAAGLTNSESGNQGTQINKMMPFKQSHQAFQNLTEISIRQCASLRTLFSPSIARGLVKLRKLEIEKCWKIEEIVAAAAEGEETEDENIFPQLRTLTFESLPNLGSFSQGKYNFMWPLLEDVEIRGCPNMKKLCLGSLSIPKEVNLRVKEESLLQELNESRSEI